MATGWQKTLRQTAQGKVTGMDFAISLAEVELLSLDPSLLTHPLRIALQVLSGSPRESIKNFQRRNASKVEPGNGGSDGTEEFRRSLYRAHAVAIRHKDQGEEEANFIVVNSDG